MLVLLFFFRGNLNFYKKNKWLRYGAYAWIFQNMVLVVSVLLRAKYYFVYYGKMTLSRIYFDKSDDKGFFTCEVTGRFFNYSYLIFIENKSSKWVITKMKQLSIE